MPNCIEVNSKFINLIDSYQELPSPYRMKDPNAPSGSIMPQINPYDPSMAPFIYWESARMQADIYHKELGIAIAQRELK